jgi:hypothetical protein
METTFNKQRFFARLLVGLAVLYFFIGINFDLNIYDEGIGLIGAERIGHGDIPYADFFTIYAPLNYYVIAGYSMLFGGSVMSPRFLDLILLVIALAVMHRIIQKSNDYQHKFFPGIALLLVLGFAHNSSYARPVVPAILFAALALLFTINQIYEEDYIWKDEDDENPEKKPKPLTKYLVRSGIAAGLVIITQQVMGLILLFVLLINPFVTFDVDLRKKIKSSLKILASAAVIVLPVAIYFLASVPFEQLYEQLIRTPLVIYPEYRQISSISPLDIFEATNIKEQLTTLWQYIYQTRAFASLPLIFVLLDIYRTKKQKSPVPDRIKATFPLALFLSLLSFTVVRIDAEHFIPIWIFLLLTLFVYFDVKNTGKISMFLIYAVIAGLLILPLAKKYQLVKKVNDKENYTKIQGIQRAERFIISKKWYADLQPAVKKIQELTDKNEKIFVCNERNDITYINDVMFYFLAERLPGTKYHELHPGVTTTLPVQKEIINDLKRNSVRYIVRMHGLNKLDKSGAVFQQAGKGAIFLDEYIITHCERVARFGMYEIMKIKYSI